MNRLFALLLSACALPLAAHCPPRWHHRQRPMVVLESAPWIRPYARVWVPRPCHPPRPRVVYFP